MCRYVSRFGREVGWNKSFISRAYLTTADLEKLQNAGELCNRIILMSKMPDKSTEIGDFFGKISVAFIKGIWYTAKGYVKNDVLRGIGRVF
jgi:hypothetical protein